VEHSQSDFPEICSDVVPRNQQQHPQITRSPAFENTFPDLHSFIHLSYSNAIGTVLSGVGVCILGRDTGSVAPVQRQIDVLNVRIED